MTVPATLTSVPAQTPYIQYTATSNQTVFAYPFEITQDSDLVVLVNGVNPGTDVGYTVSGQGNTTGGNVTFTSGQAAGTIVTLYRDCTISRVTQLTQNGGFFSASFNAEFNKIYLILQDHDDQLNGGGPGFALRIPYTNTPAPTTLLASGSYANKYLAFDSNGNPTPAALTSSGTVTQALVGGLIWPQHAGEIANSITPSNYGYVWGDVRRYGAVPDSGTTNNQTPFQNAITANAGYYPVLVDAGGAGYYGGFTTVLTVPANSTIIFRGNTEMVWASTTASSGPTVVGSACRPGFSITGSDVKFTGEGIITGPTASGTYVSQEIGIVAVGTSAAAKFTNIVIEGLTITGWGSYGILPKWIEDLYIRNNYIYACGYSGLTVMSSTNVIVTGNEIASISPGTSNNAYGMNFTYDGTTTNSRTATNHMCIGVECAYNFVHDIPIWLGITTHGSFDSRFHHNRVYNCWTAIQAAGDGSGSYCGENNDVSFNVCTLAQYNGSATTVTVSDPIGITINGNSTLHAGVTCIGNVIDGYGASASTGYSLQASYMDDPVITGNLFRNWSGYGIYMAGSTSTGGVVANNTFEAIGTTYAQDACIYLDGNTISPLVHGNVHNIKTGTAAHYGLGIVAASNGAGVVGFNDFSAAQTAPYYDIALGAVAAVSAFQVSYLPGKLQINGGIGVNGNSPATQVTGFGTPVGNAVVNNYNITDAGGASSNTNKCVAEILVVLKAAGLIGA